MKRILAVILILIVAIPFPGCTQREGPNKPLTFYYSRINYVYGNEGSIMGTEYRERQSASDDLKGWITLYLSGPLDDNLSSPFPAGIALEKVTLQDQRLIIELNSKLSLLSGMDLTIACACLSRTCFELSDAEQIIIKSPKTGNHPAVSITLNRDSITFYDTVIEANTTELLTP